MTEMYQRNNKHSLLVVSFYVRLCALEFRDIIYLKIYIYIYQPTRYLYHCTLIMYSRIKACT